MRKRMIAAAMVLTLGIISAGCGSKSASAEQGIAVTTAEETEVITDTETDSADLSDAGSDTAQTVTDSTSGSQLTGEEALEIALADSGLQEDALTGTRVKSATDHGSLCYEVDLYAEAEEYEYEIDASSGEILDKDCDYDEACSSTVSVPSGVISRDEAVALVLDRVDGATEWDLRIKLHKHDGQYIWKGDLYCDGVEYEFKISGSSGTFLEWERCSE